eukprot:758954-Hanusia_phi.AAC.5
MVEKEYVAIVAGRLEGSQGKVDMPLANQTACTKFHVIKHARSLKYGWVTMVKALPETGRKHQVCHTLTGSGEADKDIGRYGSICYHWVIR